MEQTICKRVATVKFWDGYAKWYKLWIEHTLYHQKIIEVLLAMTERGSRVLDIGAGNGILSIPLYMRGCEVTALEPSIGMRNLLYKEAFQKRIDGLNVDERIWEEVPCYEFLDYDLILACNTLHLTQMSFEEVLSKVFRAGPANVLLISAASGISACVFGLIVSYIFDLPSGASVVLMATILFASAYIFSPKRRLVKFKKREISHENDAG